ncbi:MAG: hypothetical protein OQJ89_10655, partial [Kangiellaceae bacterium]|nr:hypothetical protein [Kangiellaceae bacterium]
MIPGILINVSSNLLVKTAGVALVFLAFLLFLDSLLPRDKPISVNVREDVILSRNFTNPTVRLSYTLAITNEVNRIRSQNIVFERSGFIPKSEQLEFCHQQNNFHICTDNNYPVIWNKDGTIEVQEASRNTDLWLTDE